MTFAKVDFTMQKVLNLKWNSFMSIVSSFYLQVLHFFLFSQCYIFVFGCVHSTVVVSSCFGGFCCLFFGYVRNSVASLLCFKDFYCLFLVVCVIMLFYHVSGFFLLLLICEFFTLPPCCALSFNIIAMFMFHCAIFVGSIQLQLLLHHKCYCMHYNCCIIADFSTSQLFMHH